MAPEPAHADNLQTDAEWIIVGIAATGAAIGIGLYYAFHHSHSLKGCAVSGPNGLELQTESDQQTFQLLGVTADVKAGDRVKVIGKIKKNGKADTSNRSFLVEKLAKDYGACSVQPTGN